MVRRPSTHFERRRWVVGSRRLTETHHCRGSRSKVELPLKLNSHARRRPDVLELRSMTRKAAIARAEAYFHSGAFAVDLARRVAMPTESQNPDRAPLLAEYIEAEIKPA